MEDLAIILSFITVKIVGFVRLIFRSDPNDPSLSQQTNNEAILDDEVGNRRRLSWLFFIFKFTCIFLGGWGLIYFHYRIFLALENQGIFDAFGSFILACCFDCFFLFLVIFLPFWPEVKSYKAAFLAFGGSILCIFLLIGLIIGLFVHWQFPFQFATFVYQSTDLTYILIIPFFFVIPLVSVFAFIWNNVRVNNISAYDSVNVSRVKQGIYLSKISTFVSIVLFLVGSCSVTLIGGLSFP